MKYLFLIFFNFFAFSAYATDFHFSGTAPKDMKVSLEVYAESTNRTRLEWTIDGLKRVPLISDESVELQTDSMTNYNIITKSNWTTEGGVNYQAQLFRFHFKVPGYAEDSLTIYLSSNCSTGMNYDEFKGAAVVMKKEERKYLSARWMKKDNSLERTLCVEAGETETFEIPLNILLK